MRKIFFFLIVCLACYSEVSAQVASRPRSGRAGSWRLLGSVTARHTGDHDVIAVQGPYDYFRRIKFKVTNSPVKVHKLLITYDDGFPENIETRFDIPQGGESRVIDLKGGRRKLRTVEFWYDTKGILNGRAEVTVFGMK